MLVPNIDTEPRTPRSTQVALGAILLLAIALRLIRLGTYPYWHDEVHNLIASEDIYALVVHGNLISNHPPLPYILVALWRAIGLDASEWTMRLLPLSAGVAAVAAMYTLGKRLFNECTGLIAAFVLAIAPLHVYHSQDLKEYIYLPFVALVMVQCFYRAMNTGKMRDWLLYGLLAALACYTEIFVGPLLVAINLWALPQFRARKELVRGWFAGNLLGALLFAPWLPIMLKKADVTMVKAENWWVPAPSLAGVGYYIKAIAFGYTAPALWFKLAFALYVVLILFGAISAYRQNRRAATLILCWAILPVAIVYGISLVTESIFLIRAMLPYAIALYLLAAIGLASIPYRALRMTALGAVCVIASVGLFHQYLRDYPLSDFPHRPGTHPPRDDSGAARVILSRWQEGDIVVHSSATTWLPFHWYGFRGMPQYFAGVGGKFIADIKMGNPRNSEDPSIEYYWPREPQAIARNAKRVWFIFGEWERKYLPGNATDAYRWLDAHFSEVDRLTFKGLDVRLFLDEPSSPALARDLDDGVAADMTYAGQPKPYRKVFPENALEPRSDEARRGGLTVRWSNETAGDASPARFAQTNSTRLVQFTIENRSPLAVTADAHFLPSDYLVNCASLYERNPDDETWHIFGQHNPAPPPGHFDPGVASAHCLDARADELLGETDLPPGSFKSYIYTLGTPGDRTHGRANVSAYVGEIAAYRSPPDGAASWAWNWLPGETFDIRTKGEGMRVVADGYRDQPVFADIEAIAFVRQRAYDAPQPPIALDWPGRIAIPAGESRSFQAEIDRDTQRTDLWVYEYGYAGKRYRIFDCGVTAER